MKRRAIVADSLAWTLLGVALIAYPLLLGPVGLVLTLGWAGLFYLARASFAPSVERTRRYVGDAFLGITCFLGAYLGGWYLLPAVAAFFVRDTLTPVPGSSLLPSRPRVLAGLGIATGVAALLAIVLLVLGGPYSVAQSTITPGGTPMPATPSTAGLIAVAGVRGFLLIALVAAFAGLVTVAAVYLASGPAAPGRRRGARMGLTLGVLGLAILTIATSLSVGPWLFPIAVLAATTWLIGMRQTSRHDVEAS